MTEHHHDAKYSEMKREMQELRKRIEDLEVEKARVPTTGRTAWAWRSLRRRSWTWPRVGTAVLLALGVLGAQNKPDAMFIDQNGNVGINKTNPAKPLDVNGDAVFRNNVTVEGQATIGQATIGKGIDVSGQALIRDQIQARAQIPSINSQKLPANASVIIGNSDIYFANTPHTHTGQGNQQGFAAIENDSSKDYNALLVMGRTRNSKCPPCDRTVALWDRLGIARSNPQSALDVIGEIRGKPWISPPYQWTKGQARVQMTRSDHSVCFLTLVSGYFYGAGEVVEIVEDKGHWYLQGAAAQRDVRAQARCIGAPDNSW